MASQAEIKEAIERAVKALRLRPSLAKACYRGSARLQDGLACSYREGDRTLALDVPQAVGGQGGAPSPGTFGRAALAGCLAMGIKMWASRDGLPVTAVTVDLEVEADDRGDFGLDDVPPGYREFRLQITVESTAANSEAGQAALRAAIQRSLDCSPLLDLFTRPQEVKLALSVTLPDAAVPPTAAQ